MIALGLGFLASDHLILGVQSLPFCNAPTPHIGLATLALPLQMTQGEGVLRVVDVVPATFSEKLGITMVGERLAFALDRIDSH